MSKIFSFIVLSFLTNFLIPGNADIGIKVKVTGLKDIKGDVRIAIYDENNEFLSAKDILDYKVVPVDGEEINLVFEVEKGTYAMALIHDINSNADLDFNWIGWPIEPYGFSNNPRIFFRAPTFDECKITVQDDMEIEIKL